MIDEDKYELFKEYQDLVLDVCGQMVSKNIYLDIVEGISNTEYTNKQLPTCKYSEDGLCRLKVCMCMQYDVDDLVFIKDEDKNNKKGWFTGNCLQCDSEIEIDDACRAPCNKKGWYGCFCSYKCTKNFLGCSDSLYEDNPIIKKYNIAMKVYEEIQTKLNDKNYNCIKDMPELNYFNGYCNQCNCEVEPVNVIPCNGIFYCSETCKDNDQIDSDEF